MSKADIGLIGLGVMGENLVLNIESKGFTMACFNRTVSKVDSFLAGRAKNKNIIGCHSMEELANSLNRPRKIILMVKSGISVDALIEQLLLLIDDNDIIIDGGNSHFRDTIRRTKYVESKGKLYIGMGISGGEEGALRGPSIMPGGSAAAWEHVKTIFEKIAARTDKGEICCDWLGNNGAGHFVKMAHNGIEYGDMQLIAETYHIMREGLAMSNEQMHKVFSKWNEGVLSSYLIEITGRILAYKDEKGKAVVDSILDRAGHKGTGRWAVISAIEVGEPLTMISEAVFARFLSAMKEKRTEASKILKYSSGKLEGDKKVTIDELEKALYTSKIISYAQGFQLMQAASKKYGWNLDCGKIALLWRAGCIIRSVFLDRIKEAFERNPKLANLLLDSFFKEGINDAQASWRRVVRAAIESGIPVPAMSSALAYYDGYRTERLPSNLLQAQRDFFGSHTYERIDRPKGGFFHTNWKEEMD